MFRNKKAFVLLETIVVITVLCVILIMLYASYSKILIDVNKKSLYDNAEYIYKTNVVRNLLENQLKKTNTTVSNFMGSNYLKIYCSNTVPGVNKCNSTAVEGNDLFNFMKVNAVYFTKWDTSSLTTADFVRLEPTTQNYIKTLDTRRADGVFRIIVMFSSENDELQTDYEYATLRFGNRG